MKHLAWLRPPAERAGWPILLALAGILLVFNLIAFAFGQAPLGTLRTAFEGSWGTPYGIGQVLFKASPLILTGLAFDVALRAGLFNIGTEGQLALASLAGGYLATQLAPGTPWPLALGATLMAAIGVTLLAAMCTGAAVALIPALMRARLGVHEIISAIMLNRIVEVLLPWTLVAVLGSATLRTADAVPGALVPRLAAWIPSLGGSAASVAFPFAVLVAFAVHELLRRTRSGREMRFTGIHVEASRTEGIDVGSRMVQAMLLSGALAGLAMSATVLGYKGYYELGLGSGAGFSGIAVAMLGRGHPAGIVLAALLLGTLEQSGLAINARVPKEAMDVLEAVVIILVALANRAAFVSQRAARAAPALDEPPGGESPQPEPASRVAS